MTKTKVRVLQTFLNRANFKAGKVDGDFGSKTTAAVGRAIKSLGGAAPEGWQNWPSTRLLAVGIQIVAQLNGIQSGKIDGYWGPVTDYAYSALQYLLEHEEAPPQWRDQEPSSANPHGWPREKPQSELVAFYGSAASNQILVDLPYTHKLAWDLRTTVNRTTCHKKVADSLQRVLGRVLAHFGEDGIEELHLNRYGGCFNDRTKRGGSTKSTHAWGIALDYDPDRNRLNWGRDRAAFARPEYDAWWKIWEKEGWVSLGRTRNFDWMHVQAARV